MSVSTLDLAVQQAIAAVDDPEYPGVSIVELGLLESVEINAASVRIGLIPTFTGCPALAVIADSVAAEVGQVPGIRDVEVRWLNTPVWSITRVSAIARQALAREFTVAVQIGDAAPGCPRCGGQTEAKSMFGPSRCRSISVCAECAETIEVMRG